MSNLVRLSSISFETTKYHFPGAKDKVDLVGLLFSISLDDEFAASPPQRATRSISSDFYSRFCSTDELYEFAAAPPQRARTDATTPSQQEDGFTRYPKHGQSMPMLQQIISYRSSPYAIARGEAYPT